MFFQNCIINILGLCGFIQFGNRSWIGMPFKATNDPFPVEEECNCNRNEEKEKFEVEFDFNNILSVV